MVLSVPLQAVRYNDMAESLSIADLRLSPAYGTAEVYDVVGKSSWCDLCLGACNVGIDEVDCGVASKKTQAVEVSEGKLSVYV